MKNKKLKLLTNNEILEKEVGKFGTGSHVIIPKKYSGKHVKIIIGKARGENE
jgi:putative transposon-encoded protein